MPRRGDARRARRPAVERDARLVVARLGRHHRDLGGGHVRRVHGEHVDAASQVGAAASKRSPSNDPRRRAARDCAARREPRPGRRRRRRGRSARRHPRPSRRSPRRRSRGRRRRGRAPLRGDRPLAREPRRDPSEALGAMAWHEHAGFDVQAQPAELRPSEHLFERLAGDAAHDERLESVVASARRPRRAGAAPRPRRRRNPPRAGGRPVLLREASQHRRARRVSLSNRSGTLEGSRQQCPHLGREPIDGSVDGDAGRDLRDRQHRDR